MPGMTSLGLRYPFMSEVVDAQSWQDLADDIDAQLTALDVLRDEVLHPQTASVSRFLGSLVGLAANTNGLCTFDTENWDVGGLANLGVNNERLTLTQGIWWVQASANIDFGTITTLTYVQAAPLLDGVIMGMAMTDTTTQMPGDTTGFAVVPVFAASGVLQLRVRWNGTGGPATFNDASLRAVKLRDL